MINIRNIQATRLIFFTLGLSTACWAPLIPYVKQKLFLSDSDLGLMLLCFGIGSTMTMLFASTLLEYLGGRTLVIVGGLLNAILLPFVIYVNSRLGFGHLYLECAMLN